MREGKKHQPRILCPVKLSLKSEGERNAFSDKQKLREIIASKSVWQEMLKVLYREGNNMGQKLDLHKKEEP